MCHHRRVIDRESLWETEDEPDEEPTRLEVETDREEREPLVPTADD